MLKSLPKHSKTIEETRAELRRYTEKDIKVKDGRLFTYLYDPGIPEISKVNEIYLEFLNRNAMDYHAFPSTLVLENDLVAMVGSLLNGTEEVAGNFTTGGTESILISMKAARDHFLENHKGFSGSPEIILPLTAHPAFRKAAEYLGMKAVLVPVKDGTFMADPKSIEDAINKNSAVVVASAPSFPYGVVDPIEEIGKIAQEHGLWLHIDACVGGMILPFLPKVGVKVKKWDFSVPGVSSISVDLHKYGFTPKGSSVILYKNCDLRRYQLYVNADWPGYPMSNIGVQSTKSSAPLAASWTVMNYLGEEGYMKLARQTLNAKEKIVSGLRNLGYHIVGDAETTIFAFTSDTRDIFEVGAKLKEEGWFLQVQPGSSEFSIPPSLHLNCSPVHDKVADEFINSLAKVTKETGESGERSIEEIKKEIVTDGSNIDGSKLSQVLLSEDSPLATNGNLLYELIRHLPSKVVEKAFLDMVNRDFSASLENS